MHRARELSSSDDENSSPLFHTQRFTKSGSATANTTTPNRSSQTKIQQRNKINEPHHNLNLEGIGDDDDDSLNDDYTKKSTQRSDSTLSGTPTPKARSFLKSNTNTEKNERPSTPSRGRDSDKKSPLHSPSYGFDADNNVFSTGMKSPRSSKGNIQQLNDDEWLRNLESNPKNRRRSPEADIFDMDRRPQIKARQQQHIADKHGSRKSSVKEQSDSDNDDVIDQASQSKRFIDSSKAQKRMSSDNLVDADNRDHDHSTKVTNWNREGSNRPSSRPGSAKTTKMQDDQIERTSICDEPENVIANSQHQEQSLQNHTNRRPSSAHQTYQSQINQSAIDNVVQANTPPSTDGLKLNDSLAKVTAPVHLPPKADHAQKRVNTGGHHRTRTIKTPSRYRDIQARIDSGRRSSTNNIDLTRSVEKALQRSMTNALKAQRPNSARASLRSTTTTTLTPSKKYSNVQPRINTNLSINFDDLDTSMKRADSSQTIVDSVYLEWLKEKTETKRREKQEYAQWEKEKLKKIDRDQIEKKLLQDAQNLEQWRQKKAEEVHQKNLEKIQFKQEEAEKRKNVQVDKITEAKTNFEAWKKNKVETSAQKLKEEQEQKAYLEKQQEEKQKKLLSANKAYEMWKEKKEQYIEQKTKTQKESKKGELKKLHENEENKFMNAQAEYEKWIRKKEQDDLTKDKRQTPVVTTPFLPGGAQKNTGQVKHNVW